jgi:hypothetical protein
LSIRPSLERRDAGAARAKVKKLPTVRSFNEMVSFYTNGEVARGLTSEEETMVIVIQCLNAYEGMTEMKVFKEWTSVLEGVRAATL